MNILNVLKKESPSLLNKYTLNCARRTLSDKGYYQLYIYNNNIYFEFPKCISNC